MGELTRLGSRTDIYSAHGDEFEMRRWVVARVAMISAMTDDKDNG